jgi:nitroreductase
MDIYEAIHGRRSIRRYQTAKVGNETLIKLAQAAVTAPNGGNAQPWDFVFVTDPELITELCALLRDVHSEYYGKARKDSMAGEQLDKVVASYGRMAGAPAFVIACMRHRNRQLSQPYEEWTTLWAHHSVAAAMENLMLAAMAEGLGTCWLGTPSWQSDALRRLFIIPDDAEVIAVSPIGYPDESPKARPRLSAEEVAHHNRWGERLAEKEHDG